MEFNPEVFEFQYPAATEPTWKDKVERWYQLDPFSYGLCEGLQRWKRLEPPDALILASPSASNFMDRQFVETGATSPAKFVYTLPNVRGAPFCQALQWKGPLWCVQKDPYTLATALQEAMAWHRKYPRIWVLGVEAAPTGTFTAYRFVVDAATSLHHIEQISDTEFLRKLRFSAHDQ